MQELFQEVFNTHYTIGNETFKVVFFIKSGAKLDGAIMPYHWLEVQKLPDLTKYIFRKGELEIVLGGGYGIIKDNDSAVITWTDEIQRQLINCIKNEKLPTRFFIDPRRSNGFF